MTPTELLIEVVRDTLGDEIEFAQTVASADPEPAELRRLPCPFGECGGEVVVTLMPSHPLGVGLDLAGCDDPAHLWGVMGLALHVAVERGQL